jgi:pimeloyl-ACP methyl ester carboxylesterase
LITKDLISRGYRVVALDARSHGARKDDMKPHERLENLRSGAPEPYLAMIEGSLNDYDMLLAQANKKFGPPKRILVAGYSMGAQIAVLFAAKHKEVTHIVTMVPPAAQCANAVASINYASTVQAQCF